MSYYARIPNHLKYKLVPHAAKVCNLYKRALMELKGLHCERLEFRYQAVLLRRRFDQHKNEVDFMKCKQLLHEGELEFYKKQCVIPLRYTNDPGGVGYERDIPVVKDSVLDFWHPLEKANYPEYFAKREQRKKEYTEKWKQKYGSSSDDHDHH